MELNFSTQFTRFYPYEAVTVTDRIFNTETREEYDSFVKMVEDTLGLNLKAAKTKAIGFTEGYCNLSWDNKITFQLKAYDHVCYMTFYDGHVILGLSVIKRNYDPETHYLQITY